AVEARPAFDVHVHAVLAGRERPRDEAPGLRVGLRAAAADPFGDAREREHARAADRPAVGIGDGPLDEGVRWLRVAHVHHELLAAGTDVLERLREGVPLLRRVHVDLVGAGPAVRELETAVLLGGGDADRVLARILAERERLDPAAGERMLVGV